jgi:hypothetical protein
MNRFHSAKFLVAAALTTAALGAATVAEARPDVVVSIGFQSGPAWVQPEPVYMQPRPVYVQPRPVLVQAAPVYVRPPVVYAPQPVFERPRWGGYDSRFEWERERAWRRAEWRHREWHERYGRERDHDRRKWHHDYRD